MAAGTGLARPGPARPGTIYIAPPDHHLLLDALAMRLSRGPKERQARPAIDPLFRPAALHHGSRAIGVVLTGLLDDGSAGLRARKEGGGTAVVQDRADACPPRMPQSALDSVTADPVVPLARLGALLYELACRVAAAPSGLLLRPDRPARPAGERRPALGSIPGRRPVAAHRLLMLHF